MLEIEISKLNIKDAGPLSSILEKFDVQVGLCEKEGYTKEVARLCKLMVDFGLLDTEEWAEDIAENQDSAHEIETMLLCSRILFIRLNNIAQRDLNGINMPSIADQLNNSEDLRIYFTHVKFI